ncbi:tellurite resistance TerB family protein [Salisaeta longa]|uniref:tellurite resistance TerB family protein n=1 Tax=Salisaeta longa TaxID=503170 RepID=UPI0003B359F2|nr:TerB family tellurite resistance protein [Salisaeta longa]
MSTPSDAWTHVHDLALLYVALAYGTDHDLSDDELSSITDALKDWVTVPDNQSVRTVVMEATTAFLESDARAEVRRAIGDLSEQLDSAQRRRALTDVMRIAEADGVLLEREQGLISTVADAWSLKALGKELISDTSVAVQHRGEEWGLIHELAFLYVLTIHTAQEELNNEAIQAVLERLQPWQPSLSYENAREVVRTVLQVYSDAPEGAMIEDTVRALKEALPSVQRLAVLDDLYGLARLNGPVSDEERSFITSLAKAWGLNVRLNGRAVVPTGDADSSDEAH